MINNNLYIWNVPYQMFIPIILVIFVIINIQLYYEYTHVRQNHVSLFKFLWVLLCYRSLNQAIQHIQLNDKCPRGFNITLWWKPCVILTDRTLISGVLSTRNLAQTYVQHNFNRVHGFSNTINQYNSCDSMRNYLHQSLKLSLLEATKNNQLYQILSNHQWRLTTDHNQFDVSSRFEDFLVHVWFEFTYGHSHNLNIQDYIKCRNLILNRLKNDFHTSYLVKIPIIGSLYCQLTHWRYQSDYQEIRKLLSMMLNKSSDGFIQHFWKTLAKDHPQEIEQLVIDHSFLLILVIDFIHKVGLHFLLATSLTTQPDWEILFEQSLHQGFLYPLRFRWLTTNQLIGDQTFPAESLIIYDLKQSGLYFSTGPDACIGQMVIRREFQKFLVNFMSQWVLKLNQTQIKYCPESYNFPELDGEYIGKWQSQPKTNLDALNLIKSYSNHSGVPIYRNILNLYENPNMFAYIVDTLSHQIDLAQVNGIVGVETRGLSLAGALAYKLQLPLYLIRKQGSLPGQCYQQVYSKYNSTQEQTSILEFSCDNRIKDQQVAIIDDGISSGGTALACVQLIEQAGGQVVKFLTMVDHGRYLRINKYQPYEKLTYSCFDLSRN